MTVKIMKLILSSSLVLLAFLGMVTHPSFFSLFLLIGMLFSWHGDMTITRIGIFEKIYRRHFLIAMTSFAAGLICYTVAFWGRGLTVKAFLAVAPVYGAIMVVVWRVLMHHKETPAFLRWGSLAYGFILSVMAAAAFALFWTNRGIWIIAAIGGVLFFVSDSLVGIFELGKRKIRAYDLLVWTTYSAAQVLILASSFFVKNTGVAG